MTRVLTALALLVAVALPARAEDHFFLRDGQRVVFLGDSITFAGDYIAYLDAYLFTRFPGQKFDLINLGLPSETVSGLSEPDHPYPRPDVHERLERALTKTKPDVVVICYGMNDGIYYPFSEERFHKYQQGIQSVVERVRRAGAEVVLMTPPPFDPLPLKGKTLPRSAAKFSWVHPYEGYDEVLGRYAEWLLTLRDRGLMVVDLHGPINRYVAEVRRTDPQYRVAGDGIHPDATGHYLIAEQLLRAWNAPADLDSAAIGAGAGKATAGRVTDVAADARGVRFTWRSRVPMPADPRWDRALVAGEHPHERWNRQRLVVTGAPRERYELAEGDTRLGTVSGKELAEGVDLLRYRELPTNRHSAELWPLVAERQRLLSLAWLTDVGHKRPDTPKGLPLEEARRRAAALEERARKLAQPVKMTLRL
ncbi:MAG TPA: SGNH/GDSL hydrolase family protein, partial [Gemmataceae bacterium]|nr:SGNH/GDSL hydrolase family protein [Gemmataceae bacterium]